MLESWGVACWDWAYPSGRCNASAARESTPSRLKSRSKLAVKLQNSLGAKGPNVPIAPPGVEETQMNTRPDDRPKTNPSLASRKAGKTGPAGTTMKTRTYLLSTPTRASVMYPQTHTTIAALLLTPRTLLILLVPARFMMSSRVCEFSRLPRAGGSMIQVLPLDTLSAGAGDVEAADEDQAGLLTAGPDGVARTITKYTKARTFDGYLAFEDDRHDWQFLEAVGKAVKAAAKKGDDVR